MARGIAVFLIAAAALAAPCIAIANGVESNNAPMPAVPVCHKAPAAQKCVPAAPACAPPCSQDLAAHLGIPPTAEVSPDSLDRNTQLERLGGVIMVGAGAYIITDQVSALAWDAAHMGRVGQLPGYGHFIKTAPGKAALYNPFKWTGIPVVTFIGDSAARVPIIPTQISQAPYIGPLLHGIPLAGNIIAGPPHPIIVGAVAIDTYLVPRAQACGYTESSQFTMTDFNSPPRLRHYVNYLAPEPFTHPPIYAASTLYTGQVPYADTASAAASVTETVNIPN